MEKVAFWIGEVFLVFGGTFLLGFVLAVLFRLMCEAWVAASNRFRGICKAESLIFEYRKNRGEFLQWMEERSHEFERLANNMPPEVWVQ